MFLTHVFIERNCGEPEVVRISFGAQALVTHVWINWLQWHMFFKLDSLDICSWLVIPDKCPWQIHLMTDISWKLTPLHMSLANDFPDICSCQTWPGEFKMNNFLKNKSNINNTCAFNERFFCSEHFLQEFLLTRLFYSHLKSKMFTCTICTLNSRVFPLNSHVFPLISLENPLRIIAYKPSKRKSAHNKRILLNSRKSAQ